MVKHDLSVCVSAQVGKLRILAGAAIVLSLAGCASDIAALANDPAPVCFRATYVYGSVEVSRYHGCEKP